MTFKIVDWTTDGATLEFPYFRKLFRFAIVSLNILKNVTHYYYYKLYLLLVFVGLDQKIY